MKMRRENTVVVIFALSCLMTFWLQTASGDSRAEIRAVASRILEDPKSPIVQDRDRCQAWVSDGLLLIRQLRSSTVEAIDVENNSTTWIDISSLSVDEHGASIKTGIRLHDGILISAIEEPVTGELYSALVKYDSHGKKRIDLRLGTLREQGQWVGGEGPAFKIIDGTELPDGRIALFWLGRRNSRSHNLKLGVTFAGPDLVFDADDFYGPIDLGGRYLNGAASGDKLQACGVRLDGNRIYVVDAFTNRLLVFDLHGRELARLNLRDPSGEGRPVVVIGWSIDDHGIHFLVTTREHLGDPEPHFEHELISYRRDGRLIKTQTIPSSDAFDLRASDTGQSYIFIRGSVFRGTLK